MSHTLKSVHLITFCPSNLASLDSWDGIFGVRETLFSPPRPWKAGPPQGAVATAGISGARVAGNLGISGARVAGNLGISGARVAGNLGISGVRAAGNQGISRARVAGIGGMVKGRLAALFMLMCLVIGCRQEEVVLQPGETRVTSEVYTGKVKGFYLLNEGNMGSNKATLDRFDYTTGIYTLNIFAATNPHVVAELGDVGNDLQIYGGKLYAVINCSNLVEVMDVRTAAHLGTIEIPNCRYITFHKDKAYVSSYAGPVQINPEHEQLGFIAEIDTATLKITRKVTVGYQPEEMAIVGERLYVANSGGYYPPKYDRTLSVVDLASFTEIKKVDIAINIHRVRKDSYGDLYISCRGDYYDKASKIYVFDTKTETLKDSIDIPTSDFCIDGDTAYIFSNGWNLDGSKGAITYARFNVRTEQIIEGKFIDSEVTDKIKCPYGIAVNPETKEIFLCDAKSYVIPGTLYCLDRTGHERWHVTTGDIPAHITFL